MSGEIARWISSSPAQREHARQVDIVNRDVELVIERVNGIAAAGNTIMTNTLLLTLIQQEAERLAPASSEKLAMIVNTAVFQMVNQLGRMR